jgi:hypothetical protein
MAVFTVNGQKRLSEVLNRKGALTLQGCSLVNDRCEVEN